MGRNLLTNILKYKHSYLLSNMKPHGIKLLIRAVVKDPKGKVIYDTGEKPSKSFVIQFLEFFRFSFDGLSGNATDVNGVETTIYQVGSSYEVHDVFYANAPINESQFGIVVGTGDTAETNTDFKLETQLTEGVGVGNITHGVMNIGTTAIVGANVDLELKRSFPNNTGALITIKECGIYVKYTHYPAPPYYYHCIVRDVLAPSIDVSDKCALTVYYIFRTTV